MKVYLLEAAPDPKTRRTRLARVLRAHLNSKRAAQQTLAQMRQAANKVSTGSPAVARKGMRTVTTLTQRHAALQARASKHFHAWNKRAGGKLRLISPEVHIRHRAARTYGRAIGKPAYPENPAAHRYRIGRAPQSELLARARRSQFKHWAQSFRRAWQ